MKRRARNLMAMSIITVIIFTVVPPLVEYNIDENLPVPGPMVGNKLVLAYYYPWFANGTNYTGTVLPGYTGSLSGIIRETNYPTNWDRWESYNYTSASSLTQQEIYYWKNGLQRNYSWTDVAHWPLDGLYDVNDVKQIERHFDRCERAGIDVLICDFFGDLANDTPRLENLLMIAEWRRSNGLFAPDITFLFGVSQDWDVYVGPHGLRGADYLYEYIASFVGNYGNHPCFFKVNGKPAGFTWATYQPGIEMWRDALQRLREKYDFCLIADWGYMKPGPVDLEWMELFDGFHFYNPVGYLYNAAPVPNTPNKYTNLWWLDWANSNDPNKGIAPEIVRYGQIQSPTIKTMFQDMKRYFYTNGKIWGPTVIPGYDDRMIYPHDNSYVGRSHTTNYGAKETYDGMWEDALAIDPQWVFICSFNEIHEGTEIDASVEYGEHYIDRTGYYTNLLKNN